MLTFFGSFNKQDSSHGFFYFLSRVIQVNFTNKEIYHTMFFHEVSVGLFLHGQTNSANPRNFASSAESFSYAE